eukprot:14810572-Alexandrium_andersonii.AAC.1
MNSESGEGRKLAAVGLAAPAPTEWEACGLAGSVPWGEECWRRRRRPTGHPGRSRLRRRLSEPPQEGGCRPCRSLPPRPPQGRLQRRRPPEPRPLLPGRKGVPCRRPLEQEVQQPLHLHHQGVLWPEEQGPPACPGSLDLAAQGPLPHPGTYDATLAARRGPAGRPEE